MANFTVNYVQERNQLGAGGRIQKMVIIHLTTLMGNEGTLEIPADHYQALTSGDDGKDALRSMLAEKADSLDAPLTF